MQRIITNQHAYEFQMGGSLIIDQEPTPFRVTREAGRLVVLDHPFTDIVASGTDARELSEDMDAYLNEQRLLEPTTDFCEWDEFFSAADGDDEIK
ncbi:hypothetical protein [Hyphomicrobium sp.]|uniref:hypothetical protein n=1 Tax=Hyphomicrobium sp. TaxID=82 RepID=UPI001D8E94F6|nr:hypothetical protein [Hyphomicrobium sp.]MBY0562444.1 hypothetical protein [Hyphomicrobium sp.]